MGKSEISVVRIPLHFSNKNQCFTVVFIFRKPLVICIDDMRIQVDVNNSRPGSPTTADRPVYAGRGRHQTGNQHRSAAQVIQKAMALSSVRGINIGISN